MAGERQVDWSVAIRQGRAGATGDGWPMGGDLAMTLF